MPERATMQRMINPFALSSSAGSSRLAKDACFRVLRSAAETHPAEAMYLQLFETDGQPSDVT
jgi:hypothetical protein